MLGWLSKNNLPDFIRDISQGRLLFAQHSVKDNFYFEKTPEWIPGKHTLGDYRPVQPLKSLVFPPREILGPLFSEDDPQAVQERIVIGIKNCDLHSLGVHDYVFLHTDPVDPDYKLLRDKTLLITSDCTDCRNVCFCTAIGEQPFPKAGYDVNLSPLADGFIVETGSQRGEGIVRACSSMLKEVEETKLKERDKQRSLLSQRVSKQTSEQGLKSGLDLKTAIANTSESEFWQSFADDCVECGACNYVCCTCHCFLLVDGLFQTDDFTRSKQWDSCLHRNFARVAGGANPRALRKERLYNRFDKKFNFFMEKLGHYACDGCGRCIEACTGKIDIRDVLTRAANES